MKISFKNIHLKLPYVRIFIPIGILSLVLMFALLNIYRINSNQKEEIVLGTKKYSSLSKDFTKLQNDYEILKKVDQTVRNNELESTIKSIQKTYKDSLSVYESLQDVPSTSKELPNYKKQFAQIVKYLSDKNYASGAASISILKTLIDKEKAAIAAALGGINISGLTTSSTPPGSGYSRQLVNANGTSYIVDIVAGNLANTRVVVDVASDSDCHDNCPALPLGTYVSRNGAYAGINGSYFCPADYPTCAGKANSFDTLAMGKNKHYYNSDNNVYSTVPAVIFGNGWIRFAGRSLDWGRDTGVDGVLANQPLLISGGNNNFGGDGDPKKGSRGIRSFVANKGNAVYIGVVRNATVAEVALVLKSMGMENALNLDSGGSTALWVNGGYKAGPGRAIPNVILFVNK